MPFNLHYNENLLAMYAIECIPILYCILKIFFLTESMFFIVNVGTYVQKKLF